MAAAKKRIDDEAERLALRRARARKRKADERARVGVEARRAQAKEEQAQCLDWAKLTPHIHRVQHGKNAGCWLWRGTYTDLFGATRPVVRSGQYGRQHADVAVWLLTNGRTELPRGSFLRRECGNLRCVAPEHGVPSNAVVERARRRHKGRGQHGDLQEGQAAGLEGRLSRAV